MTRRLGVEWTTPENGIADVVGVPTTVMREFSTRRVHIEAQLHVLGRSGAKAAQQAVYWTRPNKNADVDAAALAAEWQERALDLGFDDAGIAATLHRADELGVPSPGSREADVMFRSLAGSEGLCEERTTFGRRDVIEAICDALPLGGRIDDIVALADHFLESEHAVSLDHERSEPLHRASGRLIPAGNVEHRWTTPEMLAIEQRVLASAVDRRHDSAGLASRRAVEAAVRARPTLAAEQAVMVQRLCSSGAGVEIVEGLAGSGKTFALAAANAAWTGSGFHVHGCCLAAKAAERLEEGSGIPSTTVDRLLIELDPLFGFRRLTEMDVIVVDEAAMLGTRKLDELLSYAAPARSKVVLIGDSHQLPPIDAGGAFAGLAQRLGSIELTENRRQVEPWEQSALQQVRDGQTDPALDTYLDRGRVHVADTEDELCAELVRDWWDARQGTRSVSMVAGHRRDVDELNRRARLYLFAAGELDSVEYEIGGKGFAVGDVVMALQNDRRLGISNGHLARVHDIDTRARIVLVMVHGARPVRIPFDYIEAGKLTHGYASTIHKDQGSSVDRIFVLADDTIDREMIYTALSRGRHSNDLYVTADDRRFVERHAPEIEPEPLDSLRQAVRRSSAHRMAIDQASDPDRFTPTEVLRAERELLRSQLDDEPECPNRELAAAKSKLRALRTERADALVAARDAEATLLELGPVGRHVHRRQRLDLEHQRDSADATVQDLEPKIEALAKDTNRLLRAIDRHERWAQTHQPELNRIEHVDDVIDQRSLRTVERPHAAREQPEIDFGLGL